MPVLAVLSSLDDGDDIFDDAAHVLCMAAAGIASCRSAGSGEFRLHCSAHRSDGAFEPVRGICRACFTGASCLCRNRRQRCLEAVCEVAGAFAGTAEIGLAGVSQGVDRVRQGGDVSRNELARTRRAAGLRFERMDLASDVGQWPPVPAFTCA